ncbi:hypothetical protein Tco_0487453 [Tanacetum coccineum]
MEKSLPRRTTRSTAKKQKGKLEDEKEYHKGYLRHSSKKMVFAPITTVGVSVSTAEPSAPPTTTTFIEDKDLIIAHTLMKIRSEKSKEKVKERGSKENSSEPATRPTRGVTMQEPSESGIRKAGNTQAMMEADYELAQRLQAKEQGELTIKERSRLFVELMDKRKKHFAKLRMLYDKEMKRVNSLVLMDSKVVEGSEKKMESSRKETVSKKRAGEELDEESVKRKKLEDDAKKAELQLCLEIVPRDDEVVNVESLSNKYLIVDWKTHILAEDKILLWGDLTTLFEPSEEDKIWKAQQDYTLISWRLFDLCGIHLLLTDTGITIHMLVERKYPFTQEMLSRMLSRRLEVDHECEMAYELLIFTRSQLKK